MLCVHPNPGTEQDCIAPRTIHVQMDEAPVRPYREWKPTEEYSWRHWCGPEVVMKLYGQPVQLWWLQHGAEEVSFLFSIAKENSSGGLKGNKRALGIFMGCSCQD